MSWKTILKQFFTVNVNNNPPARRTKQIPVVISDPKQESSKDTVTEPTKESEIKEEMKNIDTAAEIDKKLKSVSRKNCDNSQKSFLSVFNQLTQRHRAWDIWKDFIIMFACALSNPVDKRHYDDREAMYMNTIMKYNKQERALFPELVAHTVMALESNPEQDFLGKIYMELELHNNTKGQFFTPYHICQLMAAISTYDIVAQVEADGYITIHDPCCGAGATLIAGIHEARKQLEKVGLNWQNHVLLAAQDIDQTVALMCYIQLSLLGTAAYVKVGNSLTEPMTSGDSTENYWFTMMYFSDIWKTRRLIKRMGSLFDKKEEI